MAEDLRHRKKRHLEICLDTEAAVESGSSGLDNLILPHAAIPRVSPSDLDLSTNFLGYKLRLPLIISSMTGGSDEGRRLNQLLAETAEEAGIAIGTGSVRVLLDHPKTRNHFALKNYAPSVPVLANIGAAQLVGGRHTEIVHLATDLGCDGIYIHLNAAQEIFQTDGDMNFPGWKEAISEFLETCPLPVLIKETGAGIAPAEGLSLLTQGAAYIDVAGSGGTDWVAVEALRLSQQLAVAAKSFRNWGYPTAELLLAYRQIAIAGGESGRLVEGCIIASGGLRRPRDFAIALATGAHLTGAALPFIRHASEGGKKAVHDYVSSIEKGIRSAITLSGSGSISDFRNVRLRIPGDLLERAEEMAEEALNVKGDIR